MREASESSINGGEGLEDDLSVLPPNTRVIVRGNNRTKSVLVGLQGVVKKAVGLGGWHWLELANGIEVKLQRNALSVIEAPVGDKEDGNIGSDSTKWSSSDITSEDIQKPQRTRYRRHKTHGRANGPSSSYHSYNSESNASFPPAKSEIKIDLSKLETTALWKYWKYFNLVDAMPNPSKEQLVTAVQDHFMSQQLDELQVIVGFMQVAKRLKTACN